MASLPTDDMLLAGWRAGDRRCGEQLFDRHYDAVRRFFVNKVASHASRDLVQKTFLACVEAPNRFAAKSSFRTYLFAIGHHVLLDHLRAQHRRASREDELEPLELIDALPGPAEVADRRQQHRLLLRALRELPLEGQILLEWYYWEALSVAELSELLEIGQNTVKSRLFKAREAVVAALDRLAGDPDALRSTLDTLQLWAERTSSEAGRVRRAARP
jgi:RNA polymerase sigma factor (sigma-70 family)